VQSLQLFSTTMSSGNFKSPLLGYENAEPLSSAFSADGKSLQNPNAPLSKVYEAFPEPIKSENNGFDFHSMLYRSMHNNCLWLTCGSIVLIVYFMQTVPSEVQYARELHERIRREFPEVIIVLTLLLVYY
jgi:hypothetical protein